MSYFKWDARFRVMAVLYTPRAGTGCKYDELRQKKKKSVIVKKFGNIPVRPVEVVPRFMIYNLYEYFE